MINYNQLITLDISMSMRRNIDIIGFMSKENLTVGEMLNEIIDKQETSSLWRECPDLLLTPEEVNKEKTFLLGGKLRTLTPILEPHMSNKEPVLTEDIFKNDGLKEFGKERVEILDKGITNFLFDWTIKRCSMNDGKNKFFKKNERFKEALNDAVPYSTFRKNLDKLGLHGSLKNIKLFCLDKGEIKFVFCKNREKLGEEMFVLSADHKRLNGSFLVSTVFGFRLSNKGNYNNYFPEITKTGYVELPLKIVESLPEKYLRRYSGQRNSFCTGNQILFE